MYLYFYLRPLQHRVIEDVTFHPNYSVTTNYSVLLLLFNFYQKYQCTSILFLRGCISMINLTVSLHSLKWNSYLLNNLK